MRYFSSVLFPIFLVFGLFNSVALASINDFDEVLEQKDEIKDLKKLYERAKNGITELKDGEVPFQFSGVVKGKFDNDKEFIIPIKKKSTTQLLKKVKRKSGIVEVHYATTTFAIIEKSTLDLLFQMSSADFSKKKTVNIAGSMSDEGYDNGMGVRAYNTFYWVSSTKDGMKYYDLTESRGGWDILDNDYSYSNQHVLVGASGWNPNKVYVQQTKDYYPQGLTYDYYVPDSWYPVADTDFLAIGTNMWIDLSMRSSNWTFEFQNNIVN